MNRSNFISTYKIRCADCGHGKGICNCTGASFKFKVPPGNIVSPDFSVMPNVVISPGAAVTYNGLTIGTVIATNGQTATVRLEGAQGIVELARPTEVSMNGQVIGTVTSLSEANIADVSINPVVTTEYVTFLLLRNM